MNDKKQKNKTKANKQIPNVSPARGGRDDKVSSHKTVKKPTSKKKQNVFTPRKVADLQAKKLRAVACQG